jgi:hypothetical protein
MAFTLDNLSEIEGLADAARSEPDWTPEVERAFADFKTKVYTERPDILLDRFVSTEPEEGREALKEALSKGDMDSLRKLQLDMDAATTDTKLEELQQIASSGAALAGTVDDIKVKSPLQDTPVVGPMLSGMTQAGLEQQALLGRVFGDEDTADSFVRLSQKVGEGDKDFGDRTIAGITRSFTSMGQVGPLGAPAFIAKAALEEANRSYTTGKDAGLKGEDLAQYTLLRGGIEGLVSAAFQRAGFGGIEKSLGETLRPGLVAFAKQFAKTTRQELPEELIIEGVQAVIDWTSTVDEEAVTPERLAETALSTLAQTLGGAGLATVVQRVQTAPIRDANSFKRDDLQGEASTIASKGVGDQAVPGTTEDVETQQGPPSDDDISQRAHELWEAAGKPEGRDTEFWGQAERSLAPQKEQKLDDRGNPILDFDVPNATHRGKNIVTQNPDGSTTYEEKTDSGTTTTTIGGPTDDTSVATILGKPVAAAKSGINSLATKLVDSAFGKGFDKAFTPLSSRAARIGGGFLRRLKDYSFTRKSQEEELENRHNPDFKAIQKAIKADPKLADAISNGDFTGITDPTTLTAVNNVRAMLAQQADRLVAMKLLPEDYSREWWPRQVKDYEGLKRHLDEPIRTRIENETARKKAKLGRNLSKTERNNIANKILRGSSADLSRGGGKHLKGRTMGQLSPELNKYYDDPITSARQYIKDIIKLQARREFFGRDITDQNQQESIGNLIAEMIATGGMDAKHEAEAINLVDALFVGEDTSSSSVVSFLKQLGYFETLVNLRSTLTQLNDIAMTTMDYGAVETARAVKTTGKAFAQRYISKMTGNEKKIAGHVAQEELGIHEHGAEWDDTGKFADVLDLGLRVNFFKTFDRFGKEVRATAALSALQKRVKQGKTQALKAKYKDTGFLSDREYIKLLTDLKAGRRNELTRMIIFNEVSDLQPIDMVEMSEAYLRNEGTINRFTLSLKTFMLKQVNKVIRDVGTAYKQGGPAAAGKKLAVVYAIWTAFDLPIEMLKDWMKGRDLDIPEDFQELLEQIPGRAIDSMLGLMGMHRYSTTRVLDGDFLAISDYFTPPVFGRTAKMVQNVKGAAERPGGLWPGIVPYVKDVVYAQGYFGGEEWFKAEKRNIANIREQVTKMVEDDRRDLAAKVVRTYNQRRHDYWLAQMDWYRENGGKKPSRPTKLTVNDVVKKQRKELREEEGR